MMQLDPSSSSISTATDLNPSEQPLQVEVITYMDTDLFKAAEDGDMELFNKYHDGFHCLVDRRQNTALHIYSRTGGRQVVKTDKLFLCFQKKRLEREFSVNFVKNLVDKCPSLLLQPNDSGEIPLHIAAKYGHSDVVKFLIESAIVMQHEDVEKGFEANRMMQMLRMTDKEGNTVMHKAAESGELGVMRLLVKELDPDFPFSANKSGETPLYVAVETKRNLLVAEILDNCKSTDYGGPNGRTALHAAVIVADEKSMTKLIEANKHLTKETDDNGRTPLHNAAHYGFRGKTKLLLERDASTAYITDKDRRMTALHIAAWRGEKAIMEDIISHCPDCCEIVDKKGWNFLHFAVVSLGRDELQRFLIGYNNKIKNLPIRNLVGEKDVNGNTAFHILIFGPAASWSQRSRYFEVLKFFHRHGSKEHGYINSNSELKKKQVRNMLKEVANDAKVAGLPINPFFHKDAEEEENVKVKEEHIPQLELEARAQESHLVVATLVATVTFAAAFTVPGGYNEHQGTATLAHDKIFRNFIIANGWAFMFSIEAIIMHFVAVAARVKISNDFQRRFIQLADVFTLIAMVAMVVAFDQGIGVLKISYWRTSIGSVVFLCISFFLSVLSYYVFNFVEPHEIIHWIGSKKEALKLLKFRVSLNVRFV